LGAVPARVLVVLVGVGGALLVLQLVHHVLMRLGRRDPLPAHFGRRAHRPARWLAVVLGGYWGVRTTAGNLGWRDPVLHALVLLAIGGAAWLVAEVLLAAEDSALPRIRTDVPDNRHARQLHTRVRMLRRATIAVIALIAVAAMLVTFPAARDAGRSLLFSAGVAGVIVGFAAQSLLGNVFAGIQLAFSGAVRLDDVVVVDGEWGHVEELTLSYVVVRIWDDRRLIVPTSYLASKPFENWTRNESSVMGTVEIDVDWSVPVEAMRAELTRILNESALWDTRVSVLHVTEAVGGSVRVRAMVSAIDAGTLWDLRCLVRERLVGWVRERHPQALPRLRAELGPQSQPPPQPDGRAPSPDAAYG
jgi:small-conductance mechanosensitive channel